MPLAVLVCTCRVSCVESLRCDVGGDAYCTSRGIARRLYRGTVYCFSTERMKRNGLTSCRSSRHPVRASDEAMTKALSAATAHEVRIPLTRLVSSRSLSPLCIVMWRLFGFSQVARFGQGPEGEFAQASLGCHLHMPATDALHGAHGFLAAFRESLKCLALL